MNTKYFQTVSTIMLIFGILGLIGAISTAAGGSMKLIAGILSIVTNLLLVVGGFVGARAAKSGDTDKAPLCRTLSYILLAVAVISLVVGIVMSRNAPAAAGVSPALVSGITLIGSVISLILPVLYFLGARKFGK